LINPKRGIFFCLQDLISNYRVAGSNPTAKISEIQFSSQRDSLKTSGRRQNRVTRLDEFSPIGRFFFFGQFFENYKSSQKILSIILSTLKFVCS
jgi:hypothetical protein